MGIAEVSKCLYVDVYTSERTFCGRLELFTALQLKIRLLRCDAVFGRKNSDVSKYQYTPSKRGDRGGVAQWLRRCATNRKIAASIPDGVIGIFH